MGEICKCAHTLSNQFRSLSHYVRTNNDPSGLCVWIKRPKSLRGLDCSRLAAGVDVGRRPGSSSLAWSEVNIHKGVTLNKYVTRIFKKCSQCMHSGYKFKAESTIFTFRQVLKNLDMEALTSGTGSVSHINRVNRLNAPVNGSSLT